jgi:tRNA(His) 5'-end guanylyltransferase
MNKKDSLGDRMKEFYEDRTRYLLPRRTYTVIRIDGKAFHTYTKGLERPFDTKLITDMDKTACYICKNIQGTKLAFVQSDEISIILTDFDKLNTSAWFNGNIQKMASISASLATAKFNELRPNKIALFDSRVFTLPNREEVFNYLIWRQQDTVRNSISSVAQYLYSNKELHGKNSNEMQEMCFQKGINWNDYEPKLKRGRAIVKNYYEASGALRSKWESIDPPIFTENRHFLKGFMPDNN